jgi:two-component system CheB/CheR fusion protein
MKHRIFRKRDRSLSVQERLAGLTNGDAIEHRLPPGERAGRDAALEIGPHAMLIVAPTGELTFANLTARTLFGIAADDLGRRFSELELAHRLADLQPAVDDATRNRHRVAVGEHRYSPREGEERLLEISVVPLLPNGGPMQGVSIVFEDVSRHDSLLREVEGSRRDLELAYEELQSTIDELETTNEELQSANEELQTTNEELQSTNEELETMNEDLQSTNEELETINDELRQRSLELNEVNAFLETILSSMGVAVIVVDREQRVQIWNAESTDLWGVRADEAEGRHLFGLDIGLPLDGVRGALRRVLGGSDDRVDVELEALNRRGRNMTVRVTLLPLGVTPEGVNGAILLATPVDGRPTAGRERV